MLHLKGKQEPRWVWRYRRQRETLAAIIESLNGEESFDPVTDLKMQQCRIQIAPLDFHSGATTSSSTQYFRLRDGVQLWKGSEQMKKHSPYFKTLQKIKRKSSMPQAEKDLHIQRALAESFETARILASVNGERFTEFQSFDISKGIMKVFKGLEATIPRAMEGRFLRACHRVVTVTINGHPDSDRPSNQELEIFSGIISDGMRATTALMNDYRRRYSHIRVLYQTVPTLMVTFYLGGQVRVLHGYYDDTLHVNYTEPQQFTPDNCVEMMRSVLKWAMPVMKGDTTKVCPGIPTILEEDGEEAEEVVDEVVGETVEALEEGLEVKDVMDVDESVEKVLGEGLDVKDVEVEEIEDVKDVEEKPKPQKKETRKTKQRKNRKTGHQRVNQNVQKFKGNVHKNAFR